jgi:hypothetical protein
MLAKTPEEDTGFWFVVVGFLVSELVYACIRTYMTLIQRNDVAVMPFS